MFAFAVVIILFFVGILAIQKAFEPKYETIEIEQTIGGSLIAESVYSADQHTWDTDVVYKYVPQNRTDTLELGKGTFYKREWKKNEQIKTFANSHIILTGGDFYNDKVLIGNLNQGNWYEYEFTSEKIEKEEIWKKENVKSLLNYCCSSTYIKSINDSLITINYRYRTDENNPELYSERNIIYTYNKNEGIRILRVN